MKKTGNTNKAENTGMTGSRRKRAVRGYAAALAAVVMLLAAGCGNGEKTAEAGEGQTCMERKDQDGSDDAGVSYKTPTRIAPEQAATAVRGHEMEHVVRERAAAVREDRQVVSQSVTIHTAICPECGTVYVSGGTTRTTTAANPQAKQPEQQEGNGGFDAA